jgi:O-antigen/teichoic acid export membrane protein
MIPRFRGARILHLFSIGLLMQTLLSGASFALGLILIRRIEDVQYGYYVLVANSLLLLSTLQGSFLMPRTVLGVTRLDLAGRQNLIGGMVRLQRRLLPWIWGIALPTTAALWLSGVISFRLASLMVIALITAIATLSRDFFRAVLFAYRVPLEVLRTDVAWVVLVLAGAFGATLTRVPAHVAVLSLGLAAAVAALLLARALWRHEPWNVQSPPKVFRDVVGIGAWTTLGAGLHWAVSQGYGYLVAGMLDVRAVAAIAATRLTLMPVFLLSGGVSTLLFPITSTWLQQIGLASAVRRIALLVAGMLGLAMIYCVIMWACRDWIFTVVLKKHFPLRDPLLLTWGVVFLLTLSRDQLVNILSARERFRGVTILTACSAVVWLGCSYFATLKFAAVGAVLGILAAETLNVVGVCVLIGRELRDSERALWLRPVPSSPGAATDGVKLLDE